MLSSGKFFYGVCNDVLVDNNFLLDSEARATVRIMSLRQQVSIVSMFIWMFMFHLCPPGFFNNNVLLDVSGTSKMSGPKRIL